MNLQNNHRPESLNKFIAACSVLENLAGNISQNQPSISNISEKNNNNANDLTSRLQSALHNLLRLYHSIDFSGGWDIARLAEPVIKICEEVTAQPNITKHTVSYFAASLHVSKPTLHRAFKKYTQMTLHEFVTIECMKKARRMINEEAFTMDYIAGEVGYADRSGFNKAFRKFNKKLIQVSSD